MSLNTTPRTWTTAEIVTAAMLNAEVRDAFAGIQAGWDTYTPTWLGSTTNPVLGNGGITGRYLRIGKTMRWHVTLLMGSTTTYGSGSYTISLPAIPLLANAGEAMGYGIARDNSATSATRPFVAELSNTTTGTVAMRQTDPAAGITVGATVPFTWAVGDRLSMHGEFELP